ncbi:MAG: TolC family protein [Chlorobi bacterium]|nr:TolC family protein [Chlorobiota bacterium]MCI0716795.1 TolC family protein [Chlorobiota bacterium]
MKIIKFLFIQVFAVSSVFSQVVEITLKDAIQHAYRNNPNIVKIENSIEAQESNIRESYGNLFPDLNFTTGWTRTNQITEAGNIVINGINIPVSARNETTNNFNLSLRSNVTLFDGLVNYDRVDLAKKNKTQLAIQLRKLRQDVALAILADYLTVLKNQQIVTINEATLADSRVQLDAIKVFVEVGRRTVSDIYQQDVVVAQNELAVEQAKNNLNKSISDLAFDANLPMDKTYAVNKEEFNVNVPYETLDAYVSQNSNTDAIVNVALSNRYDYKSSQQNLDILETSIDIARGSLIFPTLNGFGSYSLSGDKIDNIKSQRVFTVGLTLTYPIFLGFSLDNQRQQALINYKSAEEDLKQVKNQITLDIQKATLDLKSLLKQIEITDRSLKNAEQNKLLAEESYRVGIGTLLDVNTAAVNLNNILINKSNLIYDFILAQKTFEYYQGLLNY